MLVLILFPSQTDTRHPGHRWQTTRCRVENITVLWAEVCGVDKVLRKVVLRKVFILKRRYGQEDFATQRGKTERELKVMLEKKQL